ncbi:hypothetical protein GCM10022407_29050 [Hymenobacter antarcticus]|uniref:Dystroglycan-type cadherin-like domain-containing protein n=1 Tax=Hymenobacter antarcticus TaxID=486270 RepID=A0ABP7QGN3_9BACT
MLLLCLVLGAGAATPAHASHFRYGTLTWRTVATDPSKRTIEFRVSQAWRRSFGATNLTVGSTVVTDQLYFGDGTSSAVNLTVTSVDVVNDSFYGEATISHTYATVGDFRAFYTNCCRLSTLSNNANGSWYVSTLVNVGSGNNSPVSTLVPVVNVAMGQAAATFKLPVSDPDGDALTFSLATVADLNGNPFANAPALAVDATTGVVTFGTVGYSVGQQFNAVIKVSDGRTSVLIDFLINITGTSNAPVFDYSITPPNGFVYQLAPGQALTFGVRASDSDPNDVVNLQAFGLPIGAGVAPALPANGNPVQTAFTWTPTAANLGTIIINFVAQDLTGVQAFTSVTVVVSQRPRFDVPPTPADRSVVQTTPGTALRYLIQASDPDATDQVSLVSATGLPAGASFATALPTAAANPVSTQLVWTPALANWGPHAVTLTARDTHNEQATHTLNFVINSAPAFTSQPSGLTRVVGQPFVYNITATDPDLPFGDQLQLLASVLPSWLRLVDNGNGTATLSGTPGAAQVGTHRVTLEAEDIYHHGNSYGNISQSFVITVVGCSSRLDATAVNPTCASPISGSIALVVTGATAPVAFAWTGPNGFRSTGQNLTTLAAGQYTVVSTDANGCTATTQATLVAPVPATPPTVTVTIAGPVPTPAQPNTIFLGYGPQTAILSATGGVSYRWKPATALSSATSANPVFTPTAAGTYEYTVVATNAAGCTASTVVKLIVVDVRCGNNPKNPKVLICHNGHEICVSVNAVPAHIGPGSKHDDYLGSCKPSSTNPADALTRAATDEAVLDAFPNPIAAGTGTTVHFRTPAKTVATVRVYNQMGTLVATLFDDVAESGRDYSFALNSAQWPVGIYLCHFVSKGETRTQRLVVAK